MQCSLATLPPLLTTGRTPLPSGLLYSVSKVEVPQFFVLCLLLFVPQMVNNILIHPCKECMVRGAGSSNTRLWPLGHRTASS